MPVTEPGRYQGGSYPYVAPIRAGTFTVAPPAAPSPAPAPRRPSRPSYGRTEEPGRAGPPPPPPSPEQFALREAILRDLMRLAAPPPAPSHAGMGLQLAQGAQFGTEMGSSPIASGNLPALRPTFTALTGQNPLVSMLGGMQPGLGAPPTPAPPREPLWGRTVGGYADALWNQLQQSSRPLAGGEQRPASFGAFRGMRGGLV